MSIEIKAGLKGRFKFTVRKGSTLEVLRETPWMDNLILDAGLNRLGTGTAAGWCQVGTSNVAPNEAQTGLVARVASTNVILSIDVVQGTAPDYRGYVEYVYRFGVGVAAGNLSEVGTGWGSVNDLWTRALIVDDLGDPTTITILADEVLDVTYQLGIYLELDDVEFDISIGGVLRSCVLRPAFITTWINTSSQNPLSGAAGGNTAAVSNDMIAVITSGPVSGAAETTKTPIAYSNNSLEYKVQFDWNLSAGNFTINSSRFSGPLGGYQVSFVPHIDKDNTKVLSLTFKWTWGRYVP
jgi:hypothetical protein